MTTENITLTLGRLEAEAILARLWEAVRATPEVDTDNLGEPIRWLLEYLTEEVERGQLVRGRR